MRMKTTFLSLLAFLCVSTKLYAQKVYVDKTTDEGRVGLRAIFESLSFLLPSTWTKEKLLEVVR